MSYSLTVPKVCVVAENICRKTMFLLHVHLPTDEKHPEGFLFSCFNYRAVFLRQQKKRQRLRLPHFRAGYKSPYPN